MFYFMQTMEHYSKPQFVEFCMQSSSLVLIYYDYFLTLGREVEYVWTRRPFNIMSLAFFLCRYSLIANMTFMFGLVHKLHHERCDEFYVVSAVFSTLGRVGIMAILGSRACAVWNYNKWVKILLGLMSALVVCVSVLHIPHVSCYAKPGQNRTPNEILTIMTVIYEVTTSVLLISGCVRNFESLNELRNDGLVVLMIKEGLIYTVLVTGLTSTGIWIYYAKPVGTFCQRLLNGFCIPLSGIMCARFFLHIRDWQKRAPNIRASKALPYAWSPPHSYYDRQPPPGSTSSSIQSHIQTYESSWTGNEDHASSEDPGHHRGLNAQHSSNGHPNDRLERAGSGRSGESSSSRAISANPSVSTHPESMYQRAGSSLLTIPSPVVPWARGERHESCEQCHCCPAHLPEGWISETPRVCEGPKSRRRVSASTAGRSSLIDVDRMLGDSRRPRGSDSVQDGYLSSDTESWSRSSRASRRKRRRQQKKRETPDVSDMV